MGPLPPMSFTGGSATGGTVRGDAAWNQGDWTINLAGSGPAMQSASPAGALLPLLAAGLVVGVLWWLMHD